MKKWLKGGLIGVSIYLFLRIIIYFYNIYLNRSYEFTTVSFPTGLSGTYIDTILFFIIGAVIGLIIQKYKK
jgi:hypothetical protein